MFVKYGQGLGLFSFLLIECYGVGYSLTCMTFSRLDGEFFELIFNVCLINELKKRKAKCEMHGGGSLVFSWFVVQML